MGIVASLGKLPGAIYLANALTVLERIEDSCIDLIYIDPPFNTGKTQRRDRLTTVRDTQGGRVGFGGQRYRTVKHSSVGYADSFADYRAFLQPYLVHAHRVLKATGSLYVHIDYREAHYCKVWLDELFGRENFINEIIWAYDYGGRPRRKWPPKHDTILFFAKDSNKYYFDTDEVERIPYMAPGLVSAEKAKRGKLPTDTWWHTIVSPTGKEKLGYPTQKPLGILRRIIAASCPPDGLAMDFFAGSGTTGAAALELGRRFLLVDSSEKAFEVMGRRFRATPQIKFVPTNCGESLAPSMEAI